jgi:RNase P subunit RPR2
MRIDSMKTIQAFSLVKEIVNRENWRCRKCDRLLGPGSEFFLPFRFDPSAKRTENLFLRCEQCGLHYSIPRRCQSEIRRSLRQPEKPRKPAAAACPECGQRMLPEGRCLTCPACGFSKCGT